MRPTLAALILVAAPAWGQEVHYPTAGVWTENVRIVNDADHAPTASLSLEPRGGGAPVACVDATTGDIAMAAAIPLALIPIDLEAYAYSGPGCTGGKSPPSATYVTEDLYPYPPAPSIVP